MKASAISLIEKVSQQSIESSMTTALLYQIYLVILTKKDLMDDNELNNTICEKVQSRKECSSLFLNDLNILKGKKILNLMRIASCEILPDEKESEAEGAKDSSQDAQDQIIQSQLLSGGLPLSMYSNFSPKRLELLESDATYLVESHPNLLQQI